MSLQAQWVVTAVALLSAGTLSSEAQAVPSARDGFYLQLTAGLGVPQVEVTGEEITPSSPGDSGSTEHWAAPQSGVSGEGSVLVGAALRAGLTLGVGGWLMVFSPNELHPTKDGQPYTLVDVKQPASQSSVVVGPFVDVYPSPALGWHVQALAGYAWASYAQITRSPFSDGNPRGLGLMGGGGYDWWLSEYWSCGLLARIVYANTRLTQTPFVDGLGFISQHQTLISPSVELSFTYH